ncbi:MAG: nuclear transport factor 2 family protein [Pseudorhizobium sp.]
MSQLSDQFMAALQKLESSRDAEPMAGLFSENAEIASPLVHHDNGGPREAKAFWTHYRDAFDAIESQFKNVREIDGVTFLEWRSQGKMGDQSFEYDGVSVLEEADGKISTFRTYFDTRHIPTASSQGGEGTGSAKGSSQSGGAVESTGADGEEAGRDEMVEAQREAAEQRAGGGYS